MTGIELFFIHLVFAAPNVYNVVDCMDSTGMDSNECVVKIIDEREPLDYSKLND